MFLARHLLSASSVPRAAQALPRVFPALRADVRPHAQYVPQQVGYYSTEAPQQPSAAPGYEPRVATDFCVYKTKAAMSVKLLPPTLTNRGNVRTVERTGVMLLEFARANDGGAPPQQGGYNPAGGLNRTYNWGAKVTFALSPVELGSLLAGDTKQPDGGLSFYHDPSKLGKTGDAAAMKTLKVKPNADGSSFFTISSGQGQDNSISVPVTKGELELVKTVARFAVPRLLGFDAVFEH